MMLPKHLAIPAAAALLTITAAGTAEAGSGCTQRAIEPTELRQAFNMAARTRDYLEQSGAEVALVARVGADLSEHGLRYTHMGAVLRNHPAGRWMFVHLLNECGADTSGIYDEGLVNFYLDDLFAFEGVVLIPKPELQHRLTAILSGPRATQLHHPVYSMIARPTATKYQNSNQWLLETIAMAQAPEGAVHTRAQAQQYFAAHGYRADTVRIGDFQRLGAAFTRANVRFDDHSSDESGNRRYEVASVRSVARYLETTGSLTTAVVLGPEGPPKPAVKY
ncbi:DUF2145 domain-containing protein [Ferrovibrio sp.]|uniref:DUF2145 domain-containing protein n=1 Tax=Ferrovibrio sp. TaxID=1917215 RepID=UPI0031200570